MKTRCQRHGFPAFTLLEMTVVMFVMAVIVGISVYSFSGVTEEEILRRPASEFQRMVMEGMRRASLEESPQTITFTTRGFTMRFLQEADGRETSADGRAWERRVEVPPDMRLSLRRWGAREFKPAAGQELVIAPSGLCEPLTIRFERGASWLELGLDPLSGGTREEAMEVAEAP
jgi:type II secretory pathway pseudopilin PulG